MKSMLIVMLLAGIASAAERPHFYVEQTFEDGSGDEALLNNFGTKASMDLEGSITRLGFVVAGDGPLELNLGYAYIARTERIGNSNLKYGTNQDTKTNAYSIGLKVYLK